MLPANQNLDLTCLARDPCLLCYRADISSRPPLIIQTFTYRNSGGEQYLPGVVSVPRRAPLWQKKSQQHRYP